MNNNYNMVFEEYEMIYKLSWYDTRRQLKSHTDMYFIDKKDLKHFFENQHDEIEEGILRITCIEININHRSFDMAFTSSRIVPVYRYNKYIKDFNQEYRLNKDKYKNEINTSNMYYSRYFLNYIIVMTELKNKF